MIIPNNKATARTMAPERKTQQIIYKRSPEMSRMDFLQLGLLYSICKTQDNTLDQNEKAFWWIQFGNDLRSYLDLLYGRGKNDQ